MQKIEKEIIRRLHENGFEIYIVGGAVRDNLLGIKPKDIDFATNAKPNEVMKIFSDKKIGVVGKRFKVAVVDNVEVATYRKDIQTKMFSAKHCKPEYAKTIQEDLKRRDLTINTMATNAITGEFLDLHGGEKDLHAGIIRLVGDPIERLAQDPNRIIRACRFLAKVEGRFAKDTYEALCSCSQYVSAYVDVGRVKEEIMKAMEVKTPSMFFSSLYMIGALDHILPGMSNCFGFTGGRYHTEDIGEHCMLAGDNISPRFPLVRLAGYFHDIGKPVSYDPADGSFKGHETTGGALTKASLVHLKFSKKEQLEVANLVYAHMRVCLGLTPKGIRRLKKYFADYDVDPRSHIRLKIADRLANIERGPSEITPIRGFIRNTGIRSFEEELPLTVNDLAIKGGELIKELGLTPGPIVGNLQKTLLHYVIEEGEEFNTYDNLKNHAIEVLKQGEKDV